MHLDELEAMARRELAVLAYPDPANSWVRPTYGPDGEEALDVVVVGAGHCGLSSAFALRRAGIHRVLVADAAEQGDEGPWSTIARMRELRTPKHQVGVEGGVPSLTAEAWYRAAHGADAWAAIDRLPRAELAAYLRWLRARFTEAGVEIRNRLAVEHIEPDAGLLRLTMADGDAGGPEPKRLVRYARHVVLATGFTGGGAWTIPEPMASTLPPAVCRHSNTRWDPATYAGKRVAILGHGASAFDAAATVLTAGAASVELCFRRPALPATNPHRAVEFTGFLDHLGDLDDLTRWRVARHFDLTDQPPARDGYCRAHAFPTFRMHPGSPWQSTAFDAATGEVVVETPRQTFRVDAVICATGGRVDLAARPELAALEPHIARWADRFDPPPGEEHPGLAAGPYLGPAFEFTERTPGSCPELRQVHAFNASSYVSHGSHLTSLSGVKFAVPRLVRGITGALMAAQTDALLEALRAWDVPEQLSFPTAAARGSMP